MLFRSKAEKQSLGVFVRSLVGLDREAAKEAFAGFLAGKTMSANQIEFLNLLIDHLTEHGDMDPGLLYESPFTDVSASGPSGMFSDAQVQELLAVIEGVRERAMG